MANIAIFRINYKSDFILTLNSDAGWMTPFCIKFWTGAPSQAYFVGFDGTTYNHCAPVDGEPTKLRVQFDDHHLPIGDLKFQIAYHFTVADFHTSVEDEVLNQASVIIEVDDAPAQVMLDFNGETAPEIEFSLPAYANEAQRIANEEERIEAEQQRIANEDARIAAEETRQQNEQQRINQETARVNEFATLKSQSQAATRDANDAATLANQKAQLAADKAALADDAATLANQKAQLAADKAALANDAAQLANAKAALAQQKAEYAQQQGGYAKDQGDYAKNQGNYAKEQGDTALADHQRAEADHGIAVDDHTQAGNDHTRAESDHGIAVDDHTQAGNDHTRAESDHGFAADDHTQAGNDHTRAESDHGIAADDHTQAGNDHTRAESDHTRAESDHAAVEVYVDSLGVFDLSKHNAVGGVLATYADLSAALTALNDLDSQYKYGGMSFKFVQSSDNKYVEYFLAKDEWSANEGDWQQLNLEEEVSQLRQDINDINGWTEHFDTLGTTPTPIYPIYEKYVIESINGVDSLIFRTRNGLDVTVYKSELPKLIGIITTPFVSVRLSEGSATDVTFTIRGLLSTKFTPYFADNITFGLTDDTMIERIKHSLIKCSFSTKQIPSKIGIYAFQISSDKVIVNFADCTNLADDDIITFDKVFAVIDQPLNGQKSGFIVCNIRYSDIIYGKAIIDVGLLRLSHPYISSTTPTTYKNSAIYNVEFSEYLDAQVSALNTNVANLNSQMTPLNSDVYELNREIKPVVDLGWGIRLKGNSNSILTPKETILLHENGDSLEIAFDDINVATIETGGYAFTKTSADQVAVRGIFVTNTQIKIRFNDGTWVNLYDTIEFSRDSKLKIEYSSNNVYIYVNDVLAYTYEGQKDLSIVSFGNGVNSQFPDYFKGVIKSVKYNNTILSFDDDFVLGSDVEFARRDGFLTEEQSKQIQNAGIVYEPLYASKTIDRLSLYKKLYDNKYIMYPLNYRYLAYTQDAYPSYYDNWGIGRPMLCEYDGTIMNEVAYLFYAAEAELAINVSRGDGTTGNVYVGGSAHGFENIVVDDNVRQVVLLVDNKSVAESDVFALKPIVSANITQKTQLVQAYTNTNPFVEATKNWIFDSNGLSITTKVKVLRSLQMINCQMGMFGAYRHWEGDSEKQYLTNRAIKANNPFKIYNISDGWDSLPENLPLRQVDIDCKKITMYGQYPYGLALNIIDYNVKSGGGMFISTNNLPYNKIYFQVAGNYTPQVDDELYATQVWEIE